jgi:hypothetical protein
MVGLTPLLLESRALHTNKVTDKGAVVKCGTGKIIDKGSAVQCGNVLSQAAILVPEV